MDHFSELVCAKQPPLGIFLMLFKSYFQNNTIHFLFLFLTLLATPTSLARQKTRCMLDSSARSFPSAMVDSDFPAEKPSRATLVDAVDFSTRTNTLRSNLKKSVSFLYDLGLK